MITTEHIPIVTGMVVASINVAQAFGLDPQLDPLTITIITVLITTLISTAVSYLVTHCLSKIWPNQLKSPGPVMRWELRKLLRTHKDDAIQQHSEEVKQSGVDVSKYDICKVAYDAIIQSGPAIYTRFA